MLAVRKLLGAQFCSSAQSLEVSHLSVFFFFFFWVGIWYLLACLEILKCYFSRRNGSILLSFVLLFPFYNKKNIDVSAFVFCRNEALDEICFKVCVCNTVRDILEGRTVSVQFNQLFLRPNKEKIEFLLEVRHFPCSNRPLLCVYQGPPVLSALPPASLLCGV